jgi:undecaprenyl-diphosphatase
MFELLRSYDAGLVRAVNGFNNPFLDDFMWFVSDKFIWFPLYAFLLYLVYRTINNTKKFVIFFALGLITVGAADGIATYGFKKQIKRYRPSHHIELSQELHFYKQSNGQEYRGGQYGFVSGHATNSFAIAVFFGLFFLKRNKKWILVALLVWAALVAVSRLYLGVHYPSDLIGGAILGSMMAYFGNRLWQNKFSKLPESLA